MAEEKKVVDDSKWNMSKNMLELTDTNMHGLYVHDMAMLNEVAPSKKRQQAYFSKNVGAWYKARKSVADTEQSERHKGFGNKASGSNVDWNLLGMSDKLKMLKDAMELAEELGYRKPLEAEVVPETKGKNRLGGE